MSAAAALIIMSGPGKKTGKPTAHVKLLDESIALANDVETSGFINATNETDLQAVADVMDYYSPLNHALGTASPLRPFQIP